MTDEYKIRYAWERVGEVGWKFKNDLLNAPVTCTPHVMPDFSGLPAKGVRTEVVTFRRQREPVVRITGKLGDTEIVVFDAEIG